jgi:arabinofuranosyltransferase
VQIGFKDNFCLNFIKKQGWLLLGCIYLCYYAFRYENEDAFIFYRYAENIASGHGWVFNHGEKINALTSVIWPMILACFGFLGFNIPMTGLLLSIFFFIASIILLKTLVDKQCGGWGQLAGILFILHPYIYLAIGLETGLCIFLILLSSYYYIRSNYLVTTILLGILLLVRYDTLLWAVVLFGDYIITKKSFPWKYLLIYLLLTVPWFLFSYGYFHAWLPTSYQVKVWYGIILNNQLTYWERFLKIFVATIPMTALGVHQNVWITNIYFYFTVFTFLFISYACRLSHWLLLISIWSVFYLCVYAYLNVPVPFTWYWVPIIMVTSVWVSVVIQNLYVYLKNNHALKKYYLAEWVTFICVLFLISTTTIYGIKVFNYVTPDKRTKGYENTGKWLRNNSSLDATVAAEDIGIMGYYSKRKFIDLNGLVTTEVIKHYAQGDLYWGITHYTPDYLVIHDKNHIAICPTAFVDSPICDTYQLMTTFPFQQKETVSIYKIK